MNYQKILAIFSICIFLASGVFAQNNYSAQKLYREYSKYEQFKKAQIPKFVIASARMFIKNDAINSVLKTVQKAKVISVNNPKYKENTKTLYSDFSSKLDNSKYKIVPSSSKNLQIFTKQKNDFVKEIAIMNRTGPTLHYILVKGKLKQSEADKFINNLNKLGVNVDNLKDKLLNELEKILNKNKNTSQPSET